MKLNTDKPADKLKDLCKELLNIFKKSDYKNTFPELLSIQEIKDNTLKDQLNQKLIESIKDKSNELYMTIPELINFQEVDSYQFKLKDRKDHSKHETLEIENLYKITKKLDINIKNLKEKWELHLLDGEDSSKLRFYIYKTLVYDCRLEDKDYHLSHGNWYKIEKSLIDKVNKKISNHKKQKIDQKDIIPYEKGDNEKEYNEKLASELDGKCLDGKLVNIQGYNKVEVCDVLYTNNNKNYFIHVKIKRSSANLSHLFNQGDVSLTHLNSKNEKFIKHIQQEAKLNNEQLEYKPHIYFLIISPSKKKDLPLFSKIVLYKMIDSIKAKSGEVSWSMISEKESIKNEEI